MKLNNIKEVEAFLNILSKLRALLFLKLTTTFLEQLQCLLTLAPNFLVS